MMYPEIPPQQEGSYQDAVSVRCLNSGAEAEAFYQIVLNRLISISHWDELMHNQSTKFVLTDAKGVNVDRAPQVDDLIKLNLPGPGHPAGQGYDWVRIADIQADNGDNSFFSFTVRPAPSPLSASQQTAHFYQSGTSNTFVVRKIGACIFAEVHGRNEKQNAREGSFWARARNVLIAFGARLGLGKFEWQNLTKALVREEDAS